LKPHADADIEILVVWIAMMSGDSYQAAQKAVRKFKDGRVKQFYDPKQLAGKAFAESLGHVDSVAWDFYLFYPVQSEWKELPPVPEVFFHQLPNSWADQKQLFEKNLLKAKLNETMQSLFP
jgi:hypothetical protein